MLCYERFKTLKGNGVTGGVQGGGGDKTAGSQTGAVRSVPLCHFVLHG